jgi:predicted dehydrogenase
MSYLRIGVVGCGGYARFHLSQFSAMPEVQIAALCDPSERELDRCAAQFPGLSGVPRFSDHRAMLAGGGLDAVLVSSPHALHAGQAVDCFATGLHVLVDKPLATSSADCRRMIEARDASGKVGALAYQRHGEGKFRFVREVVQSARLGKPRMMNSHLSQQWLQLTRGTWRQDPELSGGGQINDSGSHMVDVLLWATGLRARRVAAMMDNRGSAVDIDSVVTVEFEGGCLGSLTIVGDAVLWHERHALWLERGAVHVADDSVTMWDELGRKSEVGSWPASVSPEANFVAACLRGEEVLADFECGLRAIELTEAAWQSAREGGAPVEAASL